MNEYLENLYNRIKNGEKVSQIQRNLIWAYNKISYQKFGRICLENPIDTNEDAVELAQSLSLAGINEVFITCQFSNQLDQWAAMDAFGLKMRGIQFIENDEYIEETTRWGRSKRPEVIAAIRFSFKEA